MSFHPTQCSVCAVPPIEPRFWEIKRCHKENRKPWHDCSNWTSHPISFISCLLWLLLIGKPTAQECMQRKGAAVTENKLLGKEYFQNLDLGCFSPWSCGFCLSQSSLGSISLANFGLVAGCILICCMQLAVCPAVTQRWVSYVQFLFLMCNFLFPWCSQLHLLPCVTGWGNWGRDEELCGGKAPPASIPTEKCTIWGFSSYWPQSAFGISKMFSWA